MAPSHPVNQLILARARMAIMASDAWQHSLFRAAEHGGRDDAFRALQEIDAGGDAVMPSQGPQGDASQLSMSHEWEQDQTQLAQPQVVLEDIASTLPNDASASTTTPSTNVSTPTAPPVLEQPGMISLPLCPLMMHLCRLTMPVAC